MNTSPLRVLRQEHTRDGLTPFVRCAAPFGFLTSRHRIGLHFSLRAQVEHSKGTVGNRGSYDLTRHRTRRRRSHPSARPRQPIWLQHRSGIAHRHLRRNPEERVDRAELQDVQPHVHLRRRDHSRTRCSSAMASCSPTICIRVRPTADGSASVGSRLDRRAHTCRARRLDRKQRNHSRRRHDRRVARIVGAAPS